MDGEDWVIRKNRTVKVVPKDIRLTPLAAAVWYMEDGWNYPKGRYGILCTNGFRPDEVAFLIERLKADLSINSHLRWHKGQPEIILESSTYRDFIMMIKEEVAWDCFAYKHDLSGYSDAVPQRGEDHSLSKLTEAEVREMVKKVNSGLTQIDVASEYGVTGPALNLIMGGKRWQHLRLDLPKARVCRRLTDCNRAEILRLNACGLSQDEIADRVSTSQASVSRVLIRSREGK